MPVYRYKRSTAMIQQQKSPMNFLLVLDLVITAAFAAPIHEKQLLPGDVFHEQKISRSRRDASLPETSTLDASQASLESRGKLHGSTGSESSLETGVSLNGNKSAENKKSRASDQNEKEKLEVKDVGLPNSHVSVAGEAGDSVLEHGAASVVRGSEDGGSEESTNSNNAEESDNDSDFNINAQHEDVSEIKDADIQGSGDIELTGGHNQRQSTENGLETTEKFIASSIDHEEKGSDHTDSEKPRDALKHGDNDESSLGGNTGDLNSGSVVSGSEHQSKDSLIVSDNLKSDHKQPKALTLGDGSDSGSIGISESENVRPEDSNKPYNDGDGNVSGSGSSGTSENGSEQILSKEHSDATLGVNTSFGGTNTGSSNSEDQNENEHILPKEQTDVTLGAKITSGGSGTESSDSVNQSDNGYTKQEISSNSFEIKRELESNPASYAHQTSISGETKGSGAETDQGLNNGNILKQGIELNHSVISSEPNGKGIQRDSAIQSSVEQSELQSGDHLLANALSVGGDHKTGHEGTQESNFSEKSNSKNDNAGSSESLQNQHEVTANSNGKFNLKNGKLLSVHILRGSKDIPDSEIKDSVTRGNGNRNDGSLKVIELSGTGSESIHGKLADHGYKDFVSSTDENESKSSLECGYTAGKEDTQKKPREHRGFAWIDDKAEEANGNENGNTENSRKNIADKVTGVNVETTEASDITGSGHLNVKLQSNVGDGKESRFLANEKHEQATEIEQTKSDVPSAEGDDTNNKAEQTGRKMSSEYNENKGIEHDKVSGLPKDLGIGHEEHGGLNTALEVSSGEGTESIPEDSTVSTGKHDGSLENIQRATGESVVHPAATIVL